MTITAAADGSSLGNPGPMGWCWYIDRERWGAGGAKQGTNNIGELLAVAELLDATAAAGLAGEPLRVLCDSQYVINSVTKWMPGWKRKGWKKADGKPVMNRDILERIDAALIGREVRFEWVKGHAGHPENEAADARARAVAEAYQRGRAPDEGPGIGGSPSHGRPGIETVADLPVAQLTADERDEDAADGRGGLEEERLELGAHLELDLDFGGQEEPALEHERELLTAACRANRSRLEELLHESLVAVMADGRAHGRDEVLDRIVAAAQAGERLPAGRDFAVTPLAPNVALVRYVESDARGDESARSSVWVNEPLAQNERVWRMRFHQATSLR